MRLRQAATEAMGRRDWAEAHGLLTEALAAASGAPDAVRASLYADRAAAAARTERVPDALDDYGRAASLEPPTERVLLRRAALWLEAGCTEEAGVDLRRACLLEPANRWALQRLADAAAEERRLHRADHYAELGAERGASPDHVKRAFRRMALRWHPDKNGRGPAALGRRAAHRFRRLTEAHDVLADPAARDRYDASLRLPRAPDGLGGPADAGDVSRMLFGR